MMRVDERLWILVAALIVIAVLTLIFSRQASSILSSTTSISYNYSQCPSSICSVYVGQRISNFLLLRINANMTITGYEWILYPVARAEPVNATLRIGDSIGYSCDGSLATLVAVNRSYATFALNRTKSPYGCPI